VGYINTQAPVANLTASPATANINETVTLDGLNSQDDTIIAQYFFDFGDGTNSGWISSPLTRHEYVAEGTYDVSLVVMDEFGVRSTKVFDTVTVAIPMLAISAVWDPIAVLSQGQVLLEVSVASDDASTVEAALVHLESDSGGHFDPASGYSDVMGEFHAVFYAPEVSETTTVGITITVSKERHTSQSKTVYLSVVSPQSDGMPVENWILVAAAVILIGAVVAVILKRRSATKISRRRKSHSPTRRPSKTSRRHVSMMH
jgi:PKD repeat protein